MFCLASSGIPWTFFIEIPSSLSSESSRPSPSPSPTPITLAEWNTYVEESLGFAVLSQVGEPHLLSGEETFSFDESSSIGAQAKLVATYLRAFRDNTINMLIEDVQGDGDGDGDGDGVGAAAFRAMWRRQGKPNADMSDWKSNEVHLQMLLESAMNSISDHHHHHHHHHSIRSVKMVWVLLVRFCARRCEFLEKYAIYRYLSKTLVKHHPHLQNLGSFLMNLIVNETKAFLRPFLLAELDGDGDGDGDGHKGTWSPMSSRSRSQTQDWDAFFPFQLVYDQGVTFEDARGTLIPSPSPS